jgi:hypothetical protein
LARIDAKSHIAQPSRQLCQLAPIARHVKSTRSGNLYSNDGDVVAKASP